MIPVRSTFSRFFGERGTHLAAMVAYFALASFVPLIFLALAILGYPQPGRRVERLRPLPRGRVPEPIGRQHHARDECDPVEPHDALDRRRRRAAVELAVAVLRARVRLQHHLRPAEPGLPARQGICDRLHGDLAARPLHRIDHRHARLRPAAPLRAGGSSARDGWRRRHGGGLSARALRVPALRLLPAHECAPDPARGAAGCPRRRDRARGDVARPAAVRVRLHRRRRLAGARNHIPPARVALRDGERDRVLRRVQLRARLRTDGPDAGAETPGEVRLRPLRPRG